MMHWVLDDGPFGCLAQVVGHAWRPPRGHLHLSEYVAARAGTDKSGRRQRLLAVTTSGEPSLIVHPVVDGSDVSKMIYGHLRRTLSGTDRHLGEDESIALLALELTDAVFVTMDKGATYQALAELGPGRVASPFDLWDDLRAESCIAPGEFDRLCDLTTKGDSGLAGVPLRFWSLAARQRQGLP